MCGVPKAYPDETPISRYKIVHIIGNKIPGGAKEGFVNEV